MSWFRRHPLLWSAGVAVALVSLLWHPQRLNHDNFAKIRNGMTQAEVEELLGGPPGAYYPADPRFDAWWQKKIQDGPTPLIRRPRIYYHTYTWHDDEMTCTVAFDPDAGGVVRVRTGRYSRAELPQPPLVFNWKIFEQLYERFFEGPGSGVYPTRLHAFHAAFGQWILVGNLALLTVFGVPCLIWLPKWLNHAAFEEIEPGMTRQEVQWLLGGPPGMYYPTYAGARSNREWPCYPSYSGPAGVLSLEWWDDRHHITVYFDENGLVVGKHVRSKWRSTPYFCRLEAMCFGSREPAPLPPSQSDCEDILPETHLNSPQITSDSQLAIFTLAVSRDFHGPTQFSRLSGFR